MKMLCVDEAKRLSINEVMQHQWIKSCFVKDQNGLIQSKQSPIKEYGAVVKKFDFKSSQIAKKLARSQSDILMVKTLKMAKKKKKLVCSKDDASIGKKVKTKKKSKIE